MNTNIPQPLLDTVFAAMHYTYGNQISTHEMDGMQTFTIGGLASSRLRILAAQMQMFKPDLKTYGAVYLPMALGAVSAFASPFAHQYLGKPESEQKLPLTALSKLTIKLGETGEFVAKHSNKVINTACCVTYVAMIAFGFPISGTIGLVGLFLLLVKRQGMMPAFIDKRLEPIALAASLVAELSVPAPLLIRAIQLLVYSIVFSYYAVNNSLVKKLLPDWFLYPVPGKHEFTQPEKIDEATLRLNFRLNFSSIYTDAVSSPFSPELEKKVESISIEELFKQFEEKIGEKKNSPACKRFKAGVVGGRYEDTRPVDDLFFQKTIKALLLSIMDDEKNFKGNVDELLGIVGRNCAEGWIREIPYMLNNRSEEDYRWGVHHELMNLRGNMMKESLLTLNSEIENFVKSSDDPKVKKLNLDAFGGANGIHLVKAFEKAAWYRFRSETAENYRKVDGVSLIDSLFLSFLHRDKTRKIGPADGAYIGYKMAMTHPGLAFFVSLFIQKIVLLDLKYEGCDDEPATKRRKLKVVNWIFDAIRPEEGERKIPWNAINQWMFESSERLGIEFFDEDGDPNRAYIAGDGGNLHLTKIGVRLLLWDLGVIEPKKSVCENFSSF